MLTLKTKKAFKRMVGILNAFFVNTNNNNNNNDKKKNNKCSGILFDRLFGTKLCEKRKDRTPSQSIVTCVLFSSPYVFVTQTAAFSPNK